MASNSEIALQTAVSAVERAFAKLDAASDISAQRARESASQSEAMQNELTQSWQSHTAGLETSITGLQSENEFLKQDNLRLSNQLQQLQHDYLELQKTAEHAVGRLDGAVKQLDLILEH